MHFTRTHMGFRAIPNDLKMRGIVAFLSGIVIFYVTMCDKNTTNHDIFVF